MGNNNMMQGMNMMQGNSMMMQGNNNMMMQGNNMMQQNNMMQRGGLAMNAQQQNLMQQRASFTQQQNQMGGMKGGGKQNQMGGKGYSAMNQQQMQQNSAMEKRLTESVNACVLATCNAERHVSRCRDSEAVKALFNEEINLKPLEIARHSQDVEKLRSRWTTASNSLQSKI